MDRRKGTAGAGVGSAANTGAVSLPGSPEFAAESRALDTRSLGYRFVKRTFDIAFSACVCVVALIPGTVLCAFIAADTKGAPIYAHERAGRFGRPIRVLKFRSMVADANDVEKYLSPEQIEEWHRERKVTNDPRITKLGRVLRKTSLDELPQFFNVLAGQLSVIGPRAITYEELGNYTHEQQVQVLAVPQHYRCLAVGPAQPRDLRERPAPGVRACLREGCQPQGRLEGLLQDLWRHVRQEEDGEVAHEC